MLRRPSVRSGAWGPVLTVLAWILLGDPAAGLKPQPAGVPAATAGVMLLPTSGPILELITPDGSAVAPFPPLASQIKAAIAGGVQLVQVRDTTSPPAAKAAFARALAVELASPASAAHTAALVVNGDVRLALECSAHGVHLPERLLDQLPRARAQLALAGASVHSVETAVRAAELGAQYLQVGTMFATLTHPGKEPEGPQLLAQVRAAVPHSVPLIGVGGITEGNCGDVIRAGGAGVAAIRYLCGGGDSDPCSTAQALLAAMRAAMDAGVS